MYTILTIVTADLFCPVTVNTFPRDGQLQIFSEDGISLQEVRISIRSRTLYVSRTGCQDVTSNIHVCDGGGFFFTQIIKR